MPPPENAKVLSITELTQQVKVLIEEGFSSVWITGEISNLSKPSSGHIYLTLKDANAQLSAVVWRSSALRIRLDLQEGIEVFVRGRLTVYPARGQYQMVIEEIQPKGLGAAELALRKLKEKLQRLGYFAAERKRPLPAFPRRIALVTSPSGAAIRDMLEVLTQRWPALEILVCPVRVQGPGAAEEIAEAVKLVSRLNAADVMIVGRGGGSSEDLWAFNAECVAQAIFESTIPVVSAVGHEIDVTIADLVADVRALTPTEAAQRAVPSSEEMRQFLQQLQERFQSLLFRHLELAKQRLTDLAERRCFRVPLERVQTREQQLDEIAERVERAAGKRLGELRERVAGIAARLESLSPLNVLGRGYSLTRRLTDLRVVRAPTDVATGDVLVTNVQHGQIISRVESTGTNAPSSTS